MNRLHIVLRFLVWFFLCQPVDFVMTMLPVRRDSRRVLLVRVDSIGDMTLFLSAAQQLRRHFPCGEYEISLVCQNRVAELPGKCEEFDRVVALDKRRFVFQPWYRWRMLRQLRELGCDTVLYMNYTRDFLWGDAIVHTSGAANRWGMASNLELMTSAQRWWSDHWYTQVVDTGPDGAMELRRYARFLQAFGVAGASAAVPALHSHAPLPQGLPGKPFYVLFPGASFSFRSWPVEKFAEFARRFHAQTDWTGIICGGGMERPLAETLMKAAGDECPLINLCGQTTLWEFVSVLDAAALVVTNDTGAVHLAASTKTPSVCILGGAQPGRFLPYDVDNASTEVLPLTVTTLEPCPERGCSWFCRYRTADKQLAYPCIRDVAVQDVLEAALRAREGGDGEA